MTSNAETPEQQKHLAILQAKGKAFRWPKGKTGRTPLARFYHQAREVARRASPEMMERLVELARSSPDDRVAALCATAVLDRGGVKPIDFDPTAEQEKVAFDPRNFSGDELAVIESAMRLIVERNAEKRAVGLSAQDETGRPIDATIVESE